MTIDIKTLEQHKRAASDLAVAIRPGVGGAPQTLIIVTGNEEATEASLKAGISTEQLEITPAILRAAIKHHSIVAPPASSFTLDAVSGDSPATFTLTDTSVAGDRSISSATIHFDDSDLASITMSGSTAQFIVVGVSHTVKVTLTVVDSEGTSSSSSQSVTTTDFVPNIPPVVADQNLIAEIGTPLLIRLGSILDGNGTVVTYTLTGTADVTGTGNFRTLTATSTGVLILSATGSDGEDISAGTITVTVRAVGVNDTPIIAELQEEYPSLGSLMTFQPVLVNPQSTGLVIWSLTLAQDGVAINPMTGEVTWDLASMTCADSYYIVVTCSNLSLAGAGRRTTLIHCGKVEADIVRIGDHQQYKTVKDGLVASKSGDTLVVYPQEFIGHDNCIGRTGTERNQYLKNGTVTKYTTIMAKEIGAAVFTGGESNLNYDMFNGSSVSNIVEYQAFKGLFVSNGSYISLSGDASDKTNTRLNHIKVTECGAESIGHVPIYVRLGDFILIENCYAYGSGRYKIQCNESTDAIMRRCVSRYDRSDTDPKNDPKGGFIMYNCVRFRIQNCLALDGLNSFMASGEPVGDFGTPVTSTSATATGSFGKIQGCIQLNSDNRFGNFDMQISNGGGASDVELENVVAHDIRADQFFAYSYGAALFNRCTFSKLENRYDSTYGMINTGGNNYFRGALDCIIDDVKFTTGGSFFVRNMSTGLVDIPYAGSVWRTVEKYGFVRTNLTRFNGVRLVNQGTSVESGTTVTPIGEGLAYIVRVDPTHALAGLTGAEVMANVGKSDTFYGDQGFEDEEGQLWPFPNEELIREKFNAYTYTGITYLGGAYTNRPAGPVATIDGTRGCAAAGGSISDYIFGYNGRIAPPLGCVILPGDASVLIRWQPAPPTLLAEITGYRVYDYDAVTHAITNPRDVPATALELTVVGLINGFDSRFVVTQVTAGGESSYSYPVVMRPNGTPTLAPVFDQEPVPATTVEGTTIVFTFIAQGHDTIAWKINGGTVSTSPELSIDATVAMTGDVITVEITNIVDTTVSSPVTLTVFPVDSVPPTVSAVIVGDEFRITLTDNVYPAVDIALQLLNDGTPVGGAFDGSTLTIDLLTLSLPNGFHPLQVVATDPQTNSATSASVMYSVGAPLLTENFADTSNWTGGGLTVSNNEGTFTGTNHLSAVIWNGASDGTIKFDLKVLAAHNDFESSNFYVGTDSSGGRTRAIRVNFRDRRDRAINLFQYVNDSIVGTITESPNGIGNVSASPAEGTEVWVPIEVILSATSMIFKVDGVTTNITLDQPATPLTGGFTIAADGALPVIVLRNFNIY